MAAIEVPDDVVNALGGVEAFTGWLTVTVNEEIDKRAGRMMRGLPSMGFPVNSEVSDEHPLDE